MRKAILLPVFASGIALGIGASWLVPALRPASPGTEPVVDPFVPPAIQVDSPPPLPAETQLQHRKFPVVNIIGDFEGAVVATAKDSITLKVLFLNSYEETMGSDKARPVGEPPRVFRLSATLAADLGPSLHPPVVYAISTSDSYTMRDVKLGDVVRIQYQSVDGKEECAHISIVRLPGGRVPKAPKERSRTMPHHERMNAYQDYEEKGIRIDELWGGRRVEDILDRRMNHVKAILAVK